MIHPLAIIMAGRTYIHRFDIGNGYRRFKVTEDDYFCRFREKGTLFLMMKTVAPSIGKYGDRHFFIFETDIHTFNPRDGKILTPEMEKYFKQRLKKEEVQKFRDVIKEIEEDAIRERAHDILKKMVVRTKGDKTAPDTEEIEMELLIPSLKLAVSTEMAIDDLTPHDTINEFNSLILDGKIITALMNAAKMNKWVLVGGIIVGMALMVLMVVGYAVAFPDQWRMFAS